MRINVLYFPRLGVISSSSYKLEGISKLHGFVATKLKAIHTVSI